jgi:hypothetical protein
MVTIFMRTTLRVMLMEGAGQPAADQETPPVVVTMVEDLRTMMAAATSNVLAEEEALPELELPTGTGADSWSAGGTHGHLDSNVESGGADSDCTPGLGC